MAGPWEMFAAEPRQGAGSPPETGIYTDPETGRQVLRINITGGQARALEESPKPEERGPWQAFAAEAQPGKADAEPEEAERGTLNELGRQAGLTGRHLIEGAAAIPAMIANVPAGIFNLGADLIAGEGNGFRFPDQAQALSGLLSDAGLPEPEDATERVVGAASQALSGGGVLLKAAQRAAQSADPLIRGLGEMLMQQPMLQGLSAVTGAGAGGMTREAGGGPVAELAATLAGGLAPAAIPAAVERGALAAAGRVRGNVAGDAAQVLEAADRQGIRILPQDIGGSGIQRETQAAAQSPFGADKVDRAVNQLYDDFSRRVGEIAGDVQSPRDVGEMIGHRSAQSSGRNAAAAERTSGAVQDALGSPMDETAAGQAAQRGVSEWIRKTEETASKLYARVPIAPTSNAITTNTRQALAEFTRQMESNPKLGELFRSPRLEGYLDALTPKKRSVDTGLLDEAGDPIVRNVDEGGRLNWQDLTEFRTRVGDMLDEPRLSEKIAPRQLRALYGALSKDMEATAREQGPQAYNAWKRANDYYDGRMKRINETLSLVLGERVNKESNAALAAMEALLKRGAAGNAAGFERLMRSLPKEDAAIVRSTIVGRLRGEGKFDTDKFAKAWASLSERGKRALLPEPGMRELMEDAAARAELSTRDPLASKSGEQIFADLERMAENRGDSFKFRASMAKLSPEEANAARSLLINRMGLATPGAQNAEGTNFSISRFLTRWNQMSPDARSLLFGNADMRRDMDDLALLAERVKESEKMIGRSNTGAILTANATSGGLLGAGGALMAGHPLTAFLLAAPAGSQWIKAELLTSPRFLRWLAKAPKKPNPAAMRAHVARLSSIAASEPTIANEVGGLQQYLMGALNDNVAVGSRAAANEPSRQERADESRARWAEAADDAEDQKHHP